MKKLYKYPLYVLAGILLLSACEQEDEQPQEEIPVAYDGTRYELNYGAFPEPNLPQDNPLTVQGVKLGRMLFYDPILSKGELQSCADCHRLQDAFSDTLQFSLGVEGRPGRRQSMAIFNLAWHSNEFFWDGRAALLRDQALLPIQDDLEMNETLENAIAKLKGKKEYRDQFTRAFGDDDITAQRMALAMEQFMLSIVSYQSKYDKYLAGEVALTESEERGRQLYFTEFNPFFPEQSGADCAHCHGGINFENDRYMNNGLDTDETITDIGREEVTNVPFDKALFKVPSLRNIAVTPPYMHDGRFATLEAVIEHYNSGIQTSSTVDPALLHTQETGLMLNAQNKQDLVNFLKTLTDEEYLNKEEYKTPF